MLKNIEIGVFVGSTGAPEGQKSIWEAQSNLIGTKVNDLPKIKINGRGLLQYITLLIAKSKELLRPNDFISYFMTEIRLSVL